MQGNNWIYGENGEEGYLNDLKQKNQETTT